MTRPFRLKKSAADLLKQIQEERRAPLSAMIEIADRCNEVCVHCYQVQGEKGEMTTEEVFRILDELAEVGVLFLTISGGEPTLRNDFLDIVAHARKLKFATKIYSNGLRIDGDMARRLADLAVQEVQMSLYSHLPEVHDWVTGVPGAFDKTVAAAKALIGEGVSVVLKTPAMAMNADGVQEYIDFVTGLGAEYIVDPELVPRENGDRVTELLRASDRDYLRLQRDPRLGGKIPNRNAPEREGDLDRSLCGACTNIHIEPNGVMNPCTQLSVPVGHALRDGVRRAWQQNEDAVAMRAITWRDIHGCRDCDLQPYCGRCFANAQIEAGDALAPYSAACRRAALEYEIQHGVAPELQPGPERDNVEIGPYRRRSQGVFEAIPDVQLPHDEELARRLGWTRSRPDLATAQLPPAPPGLVQIRRPNQRRAEARPLPRTGGSDEARAVVPSRESSARPAEEGR